MSTPGENLILKLLSQSVEHVNQTCSLDAHIDGHKVDDDSANTHSIDKVGDGRKNNFSKNLICSNVAEKSQKHTTNNMTKIVKSKTKTQLQNKSVVTPNNNLFHNGTNNKAQKMVKTRRYSKNTKVVKRFTPAEIEILEKAMKKDRDNVNHKEVAKELGRTVLTVKNKINNLKEGSASYRVFTLTEDKIIMDSYLKKLVSGQKFSFMGNIPLSELVQLSLNLKRKNSIVHERWNKRLQPWILQYYSGTLNLQVVPMLTNFLAAKYSGIETIDWSVVVSKPEFAGHTESSLRYLLHSNMNELRKNSKMDDIDLLLVNKYTAQKLKEGKFKKISNRIETRQLDVAKYFQEYVDKNNITDLFQ